MASKKNKKKLAKAKKLSPQKALKLNKKIQQSSILSNI